MQAAALASMRLNLALQSAGAGFVQGSHLWGCNLKATRGGTTIFPSGTAYPAPFSSVPTDVRMLAAGIVDGGSDSDILISMAADSPTGNRDILFTPSGTAPTMITSSSLGFSPSDLFLIVPQIVPGDVGDCQIVQAASTYTPGAFVSDASLGARVASASPTTITLDTGTYGDIAAPIKLQSPSAFSLGASPTFSAFTPNSNGELVERDLLARRGDQILAENVFLMKARYGVDDGVGGTANDNIVDEWVSPSESGWTIADLMKNDFTVAQKINQIKAIRLGLVVRSRHTGSSDVNTSSLTLFSDLPSGRQVNRTLSTDEKRYDYQVYDWVIPLKNMKAVPKG